MRVNKRLHGRENPELASVESEVSGLPNVRGTCDIHSGGCELVWSSAVRPPWLCVLTSSSPSAQNHLRGSKAPSGMRKAGTACLRRWSSCLEWSVFGRSAVCEKSARLSSTESMSVRKSESAVGTDWATVVRNLAAGGMSVGRKNGVRQFDSREFSVARRIKGNDMD